MPTSRRNPPPKLLEEVRQMLRLHHYSIHTERPMWSGSSDSSVSTACSLAKASFLAKLKIESFLTGLVVHRNVAATTQNQAMNALVFLYKRVRNHSLPGKINAVRADKKLNVPVVMPRDEVAAIISLLDGTAQLVAKLLYGSGLHIMEAVRLRVKDIDGRIKQLTIRAGMGDTELSDSLSLWEAHTCNDGGCRQSTEWAKG